MSTLKYLPALGDQNTTTTAIFIHILIVYIDCIAHLYDNDTVVL